MAKKTKKRSRAAAPAKDMGQDERFSALKFNPKFALPKKNKSKVKVDERFQHMFTDGDFAGASETAVDKYGRSQKSSKKKRGAELKRFYKMNSDDEEEEEENNVEEEEGEEVEEKEVEKNNSKKKGKKVTSKNSKKKTKEEQEDDRLDYLTRLARGEVSGESSSSESEEDGSDDDDMSDAEDGFHTTKGDENASDEEEETPMGEETRRIAIQDCDWQKLKAQDLLAILNSFAPSTGKIEKVTVYVSQFGEKMMKLEDRYGPMVDPDQVKRAEAAEDDGEGVSADDDEENSVDGNGWQGNTEGEDYDPEKLRKYELDKLKYYFAVVECDTLETASILYRECDGVEYEHSSNVLDLRFIPDEMEIDRPVRDEASDVPVSYKPPEFITKALQQSKVELTWDEDDNGREDLQKWDRNDSMKNGEIVTEQDLEKFMAPNSSDSEDESGNQQKIAESKQKYKNLLAGLLEKDDGEGSDGDGGEDDMDDDEPTALEATFIPGLTERILERKRKEKLEASETPMERDRRLAKEKRQARRKEKQENVEEDNEAAAEDFVTNDPFFASEKKSKKNKKKGSKKGKYRGDEEPSGDNEAEAKETSKEELELLMAEGDPDKKLNGFDFKTIVEGEKLISRNAKIRGKKKKRKLEAVEAAKKDSYQLDTKDERFGALFSDPSFQIDRTNPQYIETKTMRQIETERAKRRRQQRESGDQDTNENASKTSSSGLEALVKSVKSKSKRK